MSTHSAQDIAEAAATDFTNRLFWAQSSQAKYAMILGDLGRVILSAITAAVAQRDESDLRVAWEAGIGTARGYGDNLFHLQGEQKERVWKRVFARLHSNFSAVAAVKEEDSATRSKRAAEILGLSQADGEDFVREADQTMQRVSGVAAPHPESTHVLQNALIEISTHCEGALTADLPKGGEMDIEGAFEQIRDIADEALKSAAPQAESTRDGVPSPEDLTA